MILSKSLAGREFCNLHGALLGSEQTRPNDGHDRNGLCKDRPRTPCGARTRRGGGVRIPMPRYISADAGPHRGSCGRARTRPSRNRGQGGGKPAPRRLLAIGRTRRDGRTARRRSSPEKQPGEAPRSHLTQVVLSRSTDVPGALRKGHPDPRSHRTHRTERITYFFPPDRDAENGIAVRFFSARPRGGSAGSDLSQIATAGRRSPAVEVVAGSVAHALPRLAAWRGPLQEEML